VLLAEQRPLKPFENVALRPFHQPGENGAKAHIGRLEFQGRGRVQARRERRCRWATQNAGSVGKPNLGVRIPLDTIEFQPQTKSTSEYKEQTRVRGNARGSWSTHEQGADERDVPVAGGEEERRDVGADLLVHGAQLCGDALAGLRLRHAPRFQPHHPGVVDVRAPRREQLAGLPRVAPRHRFDQPLRGRFTRPLLLCHRPHLPAAGDRRRAQQHSHSGSLLEGRALLSGPGCMGKLERTRRAGTE
jgi:hypothetical protein